MLARAIAALLMLALVAGLAVAAPSGAWAQTEGADVRPPEPSGGHVPGNTQGNVSDFEVWRDIRGGLQGSVSIPDKKLGVLVQSEGEAWRSIRNGPVALYGSWLMLGVIALLALFFALRGRVEIESGWSGRTVERFGPVDRFAHWITAVSFIVLALTGLNLLYGRYVLMPVLGPEVFAAITLWGKYAHNFIAFAFMLGLVLMFLLWVRHNIPNRYDLIWIAKAGGLFAKGSHPPSERFNAGQKVIFWLVILGGLSLSLSGLALLFPYEFSFFSKTFAVVNWFGLELPTDLKPLQEQQLNQIWHTIVALVMIGVILAHIYIGSIGMQGAFAAMGSGHVDENWAREHHSVWYARMTGQPSPDHHGHPNV